jgi:hypothetical protein
MLDYLNANSSLVSLIFSGVVALSTVVYAILTALLVLETRRMRRYQNEPRIEVAVRPREEWINLVNLYVRNIGLGAAYDLSFEISSSATEGVKLLVASFTESAFLTTGMKYLGPGQEVATGFSSMTDHFDEKIQAVIEVRVRYAAMDGHRYYGAFRIDMSEFKGRSMSGKPHLYSIAQSLDKMEKELGRLSSGFNRMKVDVFDRDDRAEGRKELEERIEVARAKRRDQNDNAP